MPETLTLQDAQANIEAQHGREVAATVLLDWDLVVTENGRADAEQLDILIAECDPHAAAAERRTRNHSITAELAFG